MSSSTLPKASDSSAGSVTKVSRPRRGTLQSGFSLLSRGEPKIWLTGGMLVICLAMIIGLLTLIVINGLATFWPGPLDWLILTNNQMDIGEPQAVEYGKPDSNEDESAVLTGAVMPDGAPPPKASDKPSRFYRTANFDITGRHYRWFEPQELDQTGIVRPEWALVIERLSWGRMLALPSRLSLPIQRAADSETLVGMMATDALMKELAAELEGLTATADSGETPVSAGADADQAAPTDPAEQPNQPQDETPSAADAAPRDEATKVDDAATSDASQVAETAAPAVESPVAKLNAALTSQIERTRSQQLQEAVSRRLEQGDGRVLTQASEGDPWSPLSSHEQLKTLTSLTAARVVWDTPSEILDRIDPVIGELSGKRNEIKDLMREISRLDRRLSEARVAVRQVELDTGQTLLAQVDGVGPLVEALVNLQRLERRLEESAARAPQEFSNEPEHLAMWQRLVTGYRKQVLVPALESAEAALESWRQEFAQSPAPIQNVVYGFESTWREVLDRKQPLEKQIQDLQAGNQGFELAVLVPGDPLPVELSVSDWEQLQKGQWTESSKAALSGQGLSPLDDSTEAIQQNSQVTQITFIDPARGRQTLWCIDRPANLGLSPSSEPASVADEATPSDNTLTDSTAVDTPVDEAVLSGNEVSASGGRVCLLTPERIVNCDEIVRIFPANRLSVLGKLGVYGSRWGEFLLDEPREANTEGGVFPAIWGTVVMTLIMTLAVVPFGVIAALYLREYTRSGPLVSLVRISINNLAGVPSIVYGVFGLAFFCYSVGAYIDGGPKNAEIGVLPNATWYMLLGLTVVAGVAAFLFSLLSSGNQNSLKRSRRLLARVAPALWLLSLVGVGVLVFKSPFFDGFYEARLPTPTFGKEGLMWASLTLALLTLPVVIVATEEALAAVPNSLREGSLACGASKWQTIHRIVLPHARPGILTGAILAMARGIGEVAPLMLVGALPVAPDLPLDTEFPYFHGSRSFMHLGYQIYWLGFQSQNSEASKPLVFTCTLLLLLIVVALNLSAILLRARLRRRFQGSQF